MSLLYAAAVVVVGADSADYYNDGDEHDFDRESITHDWLTRARRSFSSYFNGNKTEELLRHQFPLQIGDTLISNRGYIVKRL